MGNRGFRRLVEVPPLPPPPPSPPLSPPPPAYCPPAPALPPILLAVDDVDPNDTPNILQLVAEHLPDDGVAELAVSYWVGQDYVAAVDAPKDQLIRRLIPLLNAHSPCHLMNEGETSHQIQVFQHLISSLEHPYNYNRHRSPHRQQPSIATEDLLRLLTNTQLMQLIQIVPAAHYIL